MDLTFRDLEVQINKTEILKGVSGIARSGEMLAVMGPSGAGKSTLLSALSGRIPVNSGAITLNGELLNKQLSRKIRFVLQQDVFFPNLTLKETLTFAALLTLPDKMPTHLKHLRVQEIIDILELDKCANTIMGNAMIPGLSGGERKRATIGCEMITDPSILLLDEPTSGLDYAIASNLVKTLKRYTECNGKTIVASIHQPSSQMFYLFTNLLLIADGQVAYFGSMDGVLNHFSRVGLNCQPHYNPADFILEELRESDENQSKIIEACAQHRFEDWPTEIKKKFLKSDLEMYSRKSPVKQNGSINMNTGYINGGFGGLKPSKHSVPNNDLESVVIVEKTSKPDSLISTDLLIEQYSEPGMKWPTGFLTQYSVLTRRIIKQARHRILSKVNIIQSIIITIYASMLWYRMDRSELTLRDRMGMIFFSIVYWGFMPIIEAIGAFPGERPVILRERAAGMYRVSAYWLAKQTSELPLTMCMPVLYYLVVYWATNLNPTIWVFCVVVVTMIFFCLMLQGIGMFIGVLLEDLKTALSAAAVTMLIFMLAGGYYQRHLKDWAIWMKYISPVYYAYDLALQLEFEYGPDIKCLPTNTTAYHSCLTDGATQVTGKEVMQNLESTLPLWVDYTVAISMFFLTRIGVYLILRHIRKPSRQ